MKYTFVCYPKCSTCKKARAFLETEGIEFEERHIVENCPTKEELAAWQKTSGLPLKRFFNTSGNVYKEKQLKDKLPALTEEEQLALLSENGMLIKRPILVGGDVALLGFREAEWQNALLKKASE